MTSKLLEKFNKETVQKIEEDICDTIKNSKKLTIIDHSCGYSCDYNEDIEDILDTFDIVLPIKIDIIENKYLKNIVEFIDPMIWINIHVKQNGIETGVIDYICKEAGAIINFDNSKLDQNHLNSFLSEIKKDVIVNLDDNNNLIKEKIDKKFENFRDKIKERKNNDFIRNLNTLRNDIYKVRNNQLENLQERSIQNLLIEFPQIIEQGLTFLGKELRIGDTYNREDILYCDKNRKNLHVELKVNHQCFSHFERQMSVYIKYIDTNKERIMYISPDITQDKIDYCKEHNIEYKEIDFKKILNY